MHPIKYIFKYYKTYIFFVESVFTMETLEPVLWIGRQAVLLLPALIIIVF